MKAMLKKLILRRVTICVLVIILLACGVLATMDMPINLLPNINMPMLGVTVVYPGASASSVESDVTTVLEDNFRSISGINNTQTLSYDNVSIVILTFDYGTDIEDKKTEVKELFGTMTLPSECEEPILTAVDMNGSATATVALYNTDGDMDKLLADATSLQKRLMGIEGVGSVSLVGAPSRQINVKALSGLEMVALLLTQALSSENYDIPLGTIMADGSVVSIRNASDATSVLDIMGLPIKLQLDASVFSQLQAVQSAVRAYATCTLQEFEDNVQLTLDARQHMIDMDGMTADELQNERDGLGAMKSVMELIRNNTAPELNMMWNMGLKQIVTDPTFQNMTDEELQAIADNRGIDVELLKWARDGAKDGTLESDWNKLVAFRDIYPLSDTNGDGTKDGEDITYEQFAKLFRQGGQETVNGELKTYEGLDMVHDECGLPDCDKEHMTEQETADACQYAESVNLVAFDNIIQSRRDAEEKGETYVITDQDYAQLFSTLTAEEGSVTLMSEDVIHVIRSDNYETEVLPALREYKLRHVVTDESSPDYGKAVYANGEIYREDENGNAINKDGIRIGLDGRLVDADGNYVDANGNKLTLTDQQRLEYPYSLGEYYIFSSAELVELYSAMNADMDMGLTPTEEIVHFLRKTDFTKVTESNGTSTLLVPLSSLGYVSDDVYYDSHAQYNSHTAIVVEVYANSEANTTEVVNTVKQYISDSGLECEIVLIDDTAQFITDSVSNVLSSIIIGGVLAILVIYLFVRKIGSSLVVSITMPLSVLVALLGMWAMGISLNMVSLGGLAVGIGMLVDNSIVVLESITKRRDAGEDIYNSCVNGTAEVGGSLVASTLTNICVFFPILFTQGLTREIFYDFVWAVTFSLVMSLIVAVTVIPTLYYLIYQRTAVLTDSIKAGNLNLAIAEGNEPRAEVTTATNNQSAQQDEQDKKMSKHQRRMQKIQQRMERNAQKSLQRMNKGEGIYGKILNKLLARRVLVCVVALVVFSTSVLLVFMTGTDFMPSVDKGEIEVNMAFDSSVTLEQAQQNTEQLRDAIYNKYEEGYITQIATTVGVQGLMATDVSGKLRIKLDTSKIATGTMAQEIRQLTQEMGLSGVSVTEMDGIVATVTSGMSGMSVSIVGEDSDVLYEIAGKVEQALKEVDGIVAVTNNASQRIEQYSFVVDKYKCAEKGVEYLAVVGLLRVALSEDTVITLDIDGNSSNVIVRVAQSAVQDVDSVLNLIVGMTADGTVKVRDILRTNANGELFAEDGGVIHSYEMSVINKTDGNYVVTLDVESYGVDTGTIGKRIQNAVNTVLVDYPGYRYEESGVSSYLNEAFDGLVVALIAAFLLLYGVMACQFESLLKPFVVIMSIPFSFTGGFLALVITGTTLNIVSFVGIIMLMGVVVNGAIIMIDKIDLLIKEGMTPQQAVVEGCKSRLRPILMTTLTTVLALVPLALGLGDGGELMQPMGIVVLGGLLLGTLVTLVLIPCFYCIVKRIKFAKPPKHNAKRGKKHVEEEQEQQELQTASKTKTNNNTVQ